MDIMAGKQWYRIRWKFYGKSLEKITSSGVNITYAKNPSIPLVLNKKPHVSKLFLLYFYVLFKDNYLQTQMEKNAPELNSPSI